MKQEPLLETTKSYFTPTEKTQRGIRVYNRYSRYVYLLLALVVLGSLGLYVAIGSVSVVILAIQLVIIVVVAEVFLRLRYDITTERAVKHYALKLYETPSKETFNQLESWNNNPFDFRKQYKYAKIGKLLHDAKEAENPVEYAHEKLPDILRMIEYTEREEYGALLSLEQSETYNLEEPHIELIKEINYTYKFGAYTSTGILIRKLAQQLIRDILLAKGLYSQSSPPTYEIEIEILKNSLKNSYSNETIKQLVNSLNDSIRKKGNKAAHDKEILTKQETEALMDDSRKAIRLLIVIREETIS
jgi:hypothetical protein